jgi:hypothetical protein
VLRLHAVAFAGPRGGETDGFFLLDFCPGNLLDLLARHNFVLEERTVLHIFGCVARAVGHMHTQKPPLAHRWAAAVTHAVVLWCSVAGLLVYTQLCTVHVKGMLEL